MDFWNKWIYQRKKKFSGIPYIYPNFIISSGLAHHNYWGFIQQESISFKKIVSKKWWI